MFLEGLKLVKNHPISAEKIMFTTACFSKIPSFSNLGCHSESNPNCPNFSSENHRKNHSPYFYIHLCLECVICPFSWAMCRNTSTTKTMIVSTYFNWWELLLYKSGNSWLFGAREGGEEMYHLNQKSSILKMHVIRTVRLRHIFSCKSNKKISTTVHMIDLFACVCMCVCRWC